MKTSRCKKPRSSASRSIAVVDTNYDPALVDYAIPGNDDAIRAVQLYVRAAADAVLEGKAAAPAGRCRREGRVRRARRAGQPGHQGPTATASPRSRRRARRRRSTRRRRGPPPPHEAGADAGRRRNARPPSNRGRTCGRARRRGRTSHRAHRGAPCSRDLHSPLRRAASKHVRRSYAPSRIRGNPMAEITASLVKELRERSGAGMMECKKALTQNNGDIDVRRRVAAQDGPGQGRQEGQPRRRRRPHRDGAGRAARPCSSRSTAKPTSSPRTRTSWFANEVAQTALASGAQDVEALKSTKTSHGPTVEEAPPVADRQGRREHPGPPHGAHRQQRTTSAPTCTAAASACWSRSRAARPSSRAASRCTSPR